MCSIEAMDECIARESHELAARQASTTLTTEASPFPLQTLVQAQPSGEAPLPVSPDNGVPEIRYFAELVPSFPSKETKRPRRVSQRFLGVSQEYKEETELFLLT